MKLLLILTVLSLVFYTLFLPVQQYMALQRARTALVAGHLEAVMAHLAEARKEAPQFYAARAGALCGEVTLARARRLASGPTPDFASAASLVRDLASQCATSEHNTEVAQLLQQLATAHLHRATARCQEQAFAGALAMFQHIAAVPYPAHSLAQAREEAAWCRLAFANVLATQALFEAALEQLRRVISAEQGATREAALKQVPPVVGEEIRDWLARQDYPQVFKQLGQRQESFGEYPETAGFFARLGNEVEYQVFGVSLTRQCRTPVQPPRAVVPSPRKPGKPVQPVKHTPQQRPPGAVIMTTAPDTASPGSSPTANLILRNDTQHRLQVLVRGHEPYDVSLEPQATQELQIEPDEYVVGIYAPGNCQLQPRRSTWTIRSLAPARIRFYESAT